MRISLDGSVTGGATLELEVTTEATAADIAAAGSLRSGSGSGVDELWVGGLWVGGERLDPRHPAGVWPLIHGALVTAAPACWPVAPRGAHVAVTAGPDAGWVTPLAAAVVLGREPSPHARSPLALTLPVADPALDQTHLALAETRGGIVWRDLDTTNGTRRVGPLWSPVSRRRRGGTVRGDGELAVGRTLVALRASGPRTGAATSEGNRPGLLALPDPTSPGHVAPPWWGPVALHGPRALSTARALVLARGRRPPPSGAAEQGECLTRAVAHEEWFAWLPPAAEGDGAIVTHRSPEEASSLQIVCEPTASLVSWQGTSWRDRPLGVGEEAAGLAARAIASREAIPLPATIAWGDLEPVLPGEVAWGVTDAHSPHVWRPWGDGGHALVAGAHGAGATTALVTACAGLALRLSPAQLELIIVAPEGAAAWGESLELPHAIARVTSPDEAQAIASLETPRVAERRLVVVDGLHRFGSARVATAVAGAVASATGTQGSAVRYLTATARLPGIVTPTLLSHAVTVLALRAEDASASVDVVGVPEAALLPADAPGWAIVRHRGTAVKVRLALPLADRSPAVRVLSEPPLARQHLAAAARAAHAAS